MFKRFNLGDLLIKINYLIVVVLGLKLWVLIDYYMEHTKTFKLTLIGFIGIIIIQSGLYCIKYSK